MKKNAKRVFSAAIAASLTLSMSVIASAESHTNITVSGGSGGSGSSSVYVKPDEEPFTDVNENDWFYNDVVKVYKNKLMEGTSDTEFSPYARLTRGMVATILYRHAGSPEVTYKNVYDDLEDGLWYTDAVIWATDNGVLYGYGNGLCGPEDYVTIEQLAAIVYRYVGSPEVSGNKIAEYDDVNSITPYAVDAMEWACENDMLVGTMLHPTSVALRAEAAKMFAKILDIKAAE